MRALEITESCVDRGRFARQVKPLPSGCHEWVGKKDRDGYGRFWRNGHEYRAHRIALFIAGRSVPVGMDADHLCRNPSCVNPDHIDLVPSKTNTARGTSPVASAINARASGVCVNGHVLAEVGVYKAAPGTTAPCAECGRQRARDYKARQQGKEPRP